MDSKLTIGEQTELIYQAVEFWYEHFEADRQHEATAVLCAAAVRFVNEGESSVAELATALICAYPGLPATRVNAPTSIAIH